MLFFLIGELILWTRKKCWEVKLCGRELGGENVEDMGTCPAAIDERLDSTHGGKNAGRACSEIR